MVQNNIKYVGLIEKELNCITTVGFKTTDNGLYDLSLLHGKIKNKFFQLTMVHAPEIAVNKAF